MVLYTFASGLELTTRISCSSQQRAATLEHIVFYGGPGLGKTTLAAIIAAEQTVRHGRSQSAP